MDNTLISVIVPVYNVEPWIDAFTWGFQMKRRTIDAEVMQRAVDSQSLV